MQARAALHSGSGTPAPYGRACTNCSRAKCKCIYRSSGGSCERCHRLNKDCQPSLTVRKRNVKKPAGSKTAQLEEKLDDLVALLRSQAVAKAAQARSTASVPSGPSTSGAEGVDGEEVPPTETDISSPYTSTAGTGYARICGIPGVPSDIAPDAVQWGDLLDVDIPDYAAEQNLTVFRTYMLRYFPFVYIPTNTTASELRQARPFLWFCIMAITTRSLPQQISLGERIRRIVAQKVVVESERSIDILLGLLCYLGWSHYHKIPGKERPYLSVWTQMTIAMVNDLGLHKTPPEQSGPLCFKSFWFHARPPPIKERTMEERRAVISMFLISCILASVLKKTDTMRWTPHMDASLRELTEHPEWEGDRLLAIQARCHLITNQMAHSPWQPGDNDGPRPPPPTYFVKALLAQLQDLKRSIPPELEQNEMVLLFLYSTELSIHENEVSYCPPQTALETSEHVNALWACVQSIQAWFDVYFKIPVMMNIGVTFNVFSQLSRCFITLYRLSTLDDPAWDKSLVKANLNIVTLIERFAGIMEEIPEVAGLVGDPTSSITEQTIFTKAAKIMREMAVRWRIELDGEQQPNAAAGPEGQTGQVAPIVSDRIGEELMMDFGSDPWLSDIFVSWDSQP
ncbi:Transcriptional regulator WAR1 [Pleurostoma richardsiae]|uniref:Transcriptional regulator WAR1 n=1 Tax=Pleurostoma richardsiae TaxID=41990 RepID=A0AA38RED5_9PEZI|nr:Transcriptional regulator WAR1 [Pleurostoma richardsiae]